jgi:hypothetical protein
MEANQEKIEAEAEHCKWTPHTEGMHLLTVLQGQASNVLHGNPKEEMYEETKKRCMRRLSKHIKDQFGNQHLAAGYHNQLQIWTQNDDDLLQEFATAISQPTMLSCTR